MNQASRAPITLITPYFKAQSSTRQLELDLCLRHNCANMSVDRVILMIDDEAQPPVTSQKIIIHKLDRRPTYADWLEIVKTYNCKGSVILANSDIYFDESIYKINELLAKPQTLMALTRWELSAGSLERHPDPQWSQDSWAISTRSEITPELMQRLKFGLGVPRCDNKVAYVFATAGWSIKNPYNLIQSMHVHESGQRSYDKLLDTRIVGGVAYVFPSISLEADSSLHFETWTLGNHDIIEISLNNNLEKWKQRANSKPIAISTPTKNEVPEIKFNQLDKLKLLETGKKIFSAATKYMVYEGEEAYLLVNGTDMSKWVVLPRGGELSPRQILTNLVGPILETSINCISDSPKSESDINFWQYPCITEKQAFENHLTRRGVNFSFERNALCIYVPLPWATYIDKKAFPTELLTRIKSNISLIRFVAEHFGAALEVHTVCQHIHWKRTLEVMNDIGVTNLSLSHCEQDTQQQVRDAGFSIKVRPWTLYAVNYADKDRSEGILAGKPMAERVYLASFIGAHMAHYRSDIRLRLCEGLSKLEREDVLVDLGDMWHFNKIVYDKQVLNREMEENEIDVEKAKTIRYNQILSDSRFALCPEGAGPNTLRFWEAIAIGSVPVLFDSTLSFPVKVEEELRELCLFWEKDSFDQQFCDWLNSFELDELERRSTALREIYAELETISCF